MADSTLSQIKQRLHDIAGDSSSGFWSDDNQTRAINIARRKMWSDNFYEVVLRYAWNSIANKEDYPIANVVIPRFSTWDHVEYWQYGYPPLILPDDSTWGEPIMGGEVFGGTSVLPPPPPTPPPPPNSPTWIYTYNGPNWFKERRQRYIFTMRNEGTIERNRTIYLDPAPPTTVANSLVLYYFPTPIDMVTGATDADNNNISDPLIEAYPRASEMIAYWAAADMRRQEEQFGQAMAYQQLGDDLRMDMLTDLPRKTTQKQTAFRIERDY